MNIKPAWQVCAYWLPVVILSRLCKVVLKNNTESRLRKKYLSENSFLRNCYILTYKKTHFPFAVFTMSG